MQVSERRQKKSLNSHGNAILDSTTIPLSRSDRNLILELSQSLSQQVAATVELSTILAGRGRK
jgi:hypothetical protein